MQQQFYTQSLKSDNFAGLAHLLTYVEKYGVDISSWNLGSFKSALDFHLNQRPNINNVLIFTKYYTYYYGCRLAKESRSLGKPVSQLTEQEKYELNSRVFNHSSLVDMKSLFGHLVESLGTRQAIDPVTKDDALWRIVEFFTRPGVKDIAQFGQTSYNTLSDKDIAAYLSNRVNDSKAFEKITQVLVNLQDRENLHN